MPVIGWLYEVPGTMERILPRFSQGLAETGYIVGRNVTITSREGDRDRLPALAADLVRQHVTVIAVVGVTAAQVAKAATQTIPVRFRDSRRPRRGWRGSEPQSSLGQSHRRHQRWYRVGRKAP
jgi:hypothetical protein